MSSSPPAASPSALVVPALGLASFVSLLGTMALGPFLPALAADLGTTVARLGQALALATLLAAALGLFVGPLADRLGQRRALLIGLVAIAASTLGVALAPVYSALLVAVLVGAVGRATTGPMCQVIAGTLFHGEARRRAIAWVIAGTSGAGVAGVPLLTAIAAASNWRVAVVGLVVAALASLLLVRRVVPAALEVAGSAVEGNLLRAYAPLAGHRPTLGLLGAAALSAAGTWVAWTYLGAFYVEHYGFSVTGAGLAYMLVSLGVLPGTLAAGRQLGRLPLRPLLLGSRLAMGLLIAAAFALPVAGPISVALMALSSVMIGISGVATNTLLLGETPAGKATTMTLNQMANSLGTAAGAALGGLLLATRGYPALGVSALVGFAAAAALLAWSAPGAARQHTRPEPAAHRPG